MGKVTSALAPFLVFHRYQNCARRRIPPTPRRGRTPGVRGDPKDRFSDSGYPRSHALHPPSRLEGLSDAAARARRRARGARAGRFAGRGRAARAHRQRHPAPPPRVGLDHRLRGSARLVRGVPLPVLREPVPLDAVGREPVLGRMPALRIPEVARPATRARLRAALILPEPACPAAAPASPTRPAGCSTGSPPTTG